MSPKALCIAVSSSLLAVLPCIAVSAPARRMTAATQATGQAVSPGQAAFFESKIRPVLARSCFACHGPALQRSGLRLDSREALLKGGDKGADVIPGDPERSRLISAIRYDGALRMPPSGRLRDDEIAALTAWVKMGAPWPNTPAPTGAASGQALDMKITDAQRSFWSFRPVVEAALPRVRNAAWCISPIDRFVLAKLESKGLKPAPVADRRTLIRRVTYDLIGLPPTPEEVEHFVNDRSANAWQRVVERLLASLHYGERWGRHWLDLVRYADSNGLDENVAFANAFRYRDYVVRAFNQDKPYNEFVCEQLAGDQMPTEDDELRNDRLTATGFLSLGPKLLAEPDKPKMVMDIVDEQIEVTSKAFLGLTVACARCHNHKFDPIPTKDYYALAGIFKSTKTMSSVNTVAMWDERPLRSKQSDDEIAAYGKRVQAAQAALQAAVGSANAAVLAELHRQAQQYLQASWELLQQGEPISYGDAPARPGDPPRTLVEATKFVRGDTGRDTDHFGKGIGIILNVGGSNKVEWDVDVPAAGLYQLEVRYASAEVRPVRLLLNGKLLRVDAAAQNTGSFFPDGQRWEIVGRYDFQQGTNVLRMEGGGVIPHISRFLITQVRPPRPGIAVRSAEQIARDNGVDAATVKYVAHYAADVGENPSTLDPAARTAAADRFLDRVKLPDKSNDLYPPSDKQAVAAAEKTLEDVKKNEPGRPMAMAVEDGKGEDCRVHIRGDTQNLGDEVPRHFLSVLGGDKVIIRDTDRSGRLELAEWISRPNNPLTSRVEVNRIWQDHFGLGIVPTADNFGFLGVRPTNPALLDWLAATFVKRGWSIKEMHRLILNSNTYKMSAIPDARTSASAAQIDPDDTLLWKMPLRRLEAEPFRDSLLYLAGNLDLSIGGSLMTTKDHDYVTNDQSGNAATYNAPRRSLYLPIIRNALFDMFQAFDYGDPSMVNARRSTTTVAPQALYVMNSPFVMDQARSFAKRLLAGSPSDAARLSQAYLSALGRYPTSTEVKSALGFISSYAQRLAPTVSDPAKRKEEAWASLCHLLVASNEFIYVN